MPEHVPSIAATWCPNTWFTLAQYGTHLLVFPLSKTGKGTSITDTCHATFFAPFCWDAKHTVPTPKSGSKNTETIGMVTSQLKWKHCAPPCLNHLWMLMNNKATQLPCWRDDSTGGVGSRNTQLCRTILMNQTRPLSGNAAEISLKWRGFAYRSMTLG